MTTFETNAAPDLCVSVSNTCMGARSILRFSISSSLSRHLIVAFGTLALSVIVAAQQSPFVTSTDPFAATQSVLKVFYPEVFAHGRQVFFSAEHPADLDVWGHLTSIQFTIKNFSADTSSEYGIDGKTGKHIHPPENITFLTGVTELTVHGDLDRLALDGKLANSEQNEALKKLVESHPQWSDERAARALKSAGALFGSKDENDLLKSLPLSELEKTLGLTVVSCEDCKNYFGLPFRPISFSGWSNSKHQGDFVGFSWDIVMEAHSSDGRTKKYDFSFEPFRGKLVGINAWWETRSTPESQQVPPTPR
jgi:hypothetical protein